MGLNLINKRHADELWKRIKEKEEKQHVRQVSPYRVLLKKIFFPLFSKYSTKFEYI